jgi:hypothetical protein
MWSAINQPITTPDEAIKCRTLRISLLGHERLTATTGASPQGRPIVAGQEAKAKTAKSSEPTEEVTGSLSEIT